MLTGHAPCPDGRVQIGPGDDAAVLHDGAVITVDALVEGIHWDERLSPADVGFKALAVSVSDLAAMGARPEWMVLAVSLPAPADRAWVAAFASGLAEAAQRWDVALVGGDTTRSPGPRYVAVTAGGRAERPITRSGGRPGDDLWVTGCPGLASAGYALDDPPADALSALRRPDPPVAFALAVAASGDVTAMMDLSDGLAADLPRLCGASGTGATVDPGAMPRHPALAGEARELELQLAGGDDYQLLFAAPAATAADLRALAAAHRIRLTRIGSLTADPAVALTGRPWPTPAFRHFGAA